MSVYLPTDPDQAILAASLTERASSLLNSAEGLLKAALVVIVLFFLIKNLVESFTVARLIISTVIGAAAVAIGTNMSIFADSAEEEFENTAHPAQIVEVVHTGVIDHPKSIVVEA